MNNVLNISKGMIDDLKSDGAFFTLHARRSTRNLPSIALTPFASKLQDSGPLFPDLFFEVSA